MFRSPIDQRFGRTERTKSPFLDQGRIRALVGRGGPSHRSSVEFANADDEGLSLKNPPPQQGPSETSQDSGNPHLNNGPQSLARLTKTWAWKEAWTPHPAMESAPTLRWQASTGFPGPLFNLLPDSLERAADAFDA